MRECADDFDLAARTAGILGSASGARKALDEMDRRTAAGESCGIWLIRNTWIVGPIDYDRASLRPTDGDAA